MQRQASQWHCKQSNQNQLREDLKPPGAIGKKDYFLKAFLTSSQGRGYQVLVDAKEPWKKATGR